MRKANNQEISAMGVLASHQTFTSHSHLVLRAHKFRLYPNREQEELLAKHFGCCRFVYNHFLEERKRAYEEERKALNYCANAKDLTSLKKSDEFCWLGEVYSHALQASLRHLDVAYQRFFKKQAKFPRFHSKHDRQSCTFPDNVKVVDGRLSLPKFGGTMKMRGGMPVDGIVRQATVCKTPTGKYFVSILCEDVVEKLPENGNGVGIDLGLKEMAVCSNGERVANPKFLERGELHLKHLQRQVSKKKKGSDRRRRAMVVLSRFHEKVANRRRDYIHKFTSRIVRENQTVCVEDLNVKGMESNHHLAKGVASVSFGEIVQQLEYKCRWRGREFVKIERFFPSSKRCNHCGTINKDLTLADREWVCKECGSVIDRDFNASLNIRDRGIEILSGCGRWSDVKQKGGEAAA